MTKKDLNRVPISSANVSATQCNKISKNMQNKLPPSSIVMITLLEKAKKRQKEMKKKTRLRSDLDIVHAIAFRPTK